MAIRIQVDVNVYHHNVDTAFQQQVAALTEKLKARNEHLSQVVSDLVRQSSDPVQPRAKKGAQT